MAITSRPYTVPSMVVKLQDRLNELYDEGIETFLRSITEIPWSQPALKISVTNKCNLSCTYCYDRANQPPFQEPADMEPALVSQIFERYPNPSYVFVLGGEPFLNPEAVEAILEQCQSRVAISTNGQISNNQADHILEKIVQRNKLGRAALLQVSCELGGLTVERYAQNAQYVENILTHFAHICGRYMKVKYTMTQPNVAHIKRIAQWYWDRKLLVQFDYADGGFGAGVPTDLPDEDYITIFEFTLQTLQCSFVRWLQNESDCWPILRAKTLVNHIFPIVLMQIKQQQPIWSACGILGNGIYVGPRGDLYPCHRFKQSEQKQYGILEEEITSKIAQFHREVKPVIRDCCHNCIWRGTCGGTCPAVIYNYGSKMLEGRCKFTGALRDAFWSFLVDDQNLSHPKIDRYLSEVVRFSPFHSITQMS